MAPIGITQRPARLVFGALCAAALAHALAVATVLPRSGPLLTTYAASSGFASALDLAAGLALLAAGILAWHERSGASLGPLALLMSIVWFGPDWIGWEDGAAFARSLGMLAAPLAFALLVHLALAAPLGRLAGRAARATVAVAYAAAAVASAGRALFRDPFEDPDCWSNCTDNVLLVQADRGLAEVLDVLWRSSTLAAALLVAGLAVWRLWRATVTARRALWPVLLPAALVGAAEGAYAVALLRTPAENPERTVFAVLFVARAVSVIGLAAGIAWTVLRARRLRASVARLAVERQAADPAVPLRDALAHALGDPTLQVAYPLPGSGRPVDARGAPVALPVGGSDRAVTQIVRDGEPVAVVTHDATLLDGPALAREIGAAARLAVDNERLRAAVLAQLDDLRASRARIVEAGDAERRRLERNLHDGAQQRLLALSYELRLARSGAGDDGTAALLAAATVEAQVALRELRELAHGIYPAILAEAGLEPALATLADTAPLPVVLGEIAPGRHSGAVETAAYVAVAAGVEDAAARAATQVEIDVIRRGSELAVVVADDGGRRTASMQHVADRIGALGGRLEAGPRTLEALIPCG